MNVYFACSITGGRAYEAVYQAITRALTSDGIVIPTAHLAETGVVDEEKIIEPRVVFERDVNWIRGAQALIAEVSAPSHGVGYEIGLALELGKPVLCLHEQRRAVSKMITGNPHPKLSVKAYETPEQAVELAREFLAQVKLYL
ncbi:MAG: nucleoside 2-deoxyribosyltransferase [Chloroflexi bacterium]|nr:nucleoside 2-deoxyribosyltransferase [Chloroflexota bacterium]